MDDIPRAPTICDFWHPIYRSSWIEKIAKIEPLFARFFHKSAGLLIWTREARVADPRAKDGPSQSNLAYSWAPKTACVTARGIYENW